MTFCEEWDDTYKKGQQLSIWPWSDVVSYVMRYARPSSPDFRVLELGFGAGANIPFFLKLGVKYYGVEGSPAIVEQISDQYPQIKENIVAADFTKEIPFEGPFDLVIDRSSVTHNSTESIQHCLKTVQSKMKPGALFLGFDWFSVNHSDYDKGTPVEDDRTRTNFRDGQFVGVGSIHFSDEKHLRDLFKNFKIELLEEKTIQRAEPDDAWNFASWNLVARN